MRRWGLRARFLALLVSLLVVVFGALTYVIVHQNTSTLRKDLVEQSKSFASLATQPIGDTFVLYHDSGSIRIQQQIDRFTDLDPNINQVEVIDTSGKPLFTSNASSPIAVSQTAARQLNVSYIYGKKGNLSAIVQPYLENFGIHRYALVYGISYASVDKSIATTIAFILVLSTAILLVLIILFYILINRFFLDPVAYVSRMALLISRGDLNRQVHSGRNDEIGDLANAVDTMANSLKADIAKLKEVDELKNEFLIITSHNLRTPLTVISSYLEAITDVAEGDEMKKLLEPLRVNVMRLGGFAEDVLTISTLEAGQKNILRPEPTDMGPVLKSIAGDFAAMAKEKNLRFEARVDLAAKVNLSKPHFRSALWNLLDNAYKFTDENGEVTLSAEAADGKIRIAVKDNGVGIKAEEIPHLFTKFHRANDLMRYNYEGTGIGLYISKLIINQHGGDISAQSQEGHGSTFTITLPTITERPAGDYAGRSDPDTDIDRSASDSDNAS